MRRSGNIIIPIALSAVALWSLFAILYCGDISLAPKCLFRTLTGCDCPMCGVQRALASCVRGEWKEAFWYNPYMVLVSPYIVLVFASLLPVRSRFMNLLRRGVYNIFVVAFFVLLMLAWWVVRNTAFWHGMAA